jgi:hypothetical protein
LDALRKAVQQHPLQAEYGVGQRVRRSCGDCPPRADKVEVDPRRRPAAATVIDSLKVAETHEFSFEPPAFMAEHERLQRLAFARSDEEGELIF